MDLKETQWLIALTNFAGVKIMKINGLIILSVIAVALIGCGKSPNGRSSADQFADEQTTGSLGSSGQNLEFYSERYLPTDQRLEKRQQRLLEIVHEKS